MTNTQPDNSRATKTGPFNLLLTQETGIARELFHSHVRGNESVQMKLRGRACAREEHLLESVAR